jgi:hexosaminidase
VGVALVPQPHVLIVGEGDLDWVPRRFVVEPEWRDVVDVFLVDVAALVRDANISLVVDGDGDLAIGLNPELGAEEYWLEVDDAIRIRAGGPAGAAYALTTLGQLLADAPRTELTGGRRLPRLTIEDRPTWAWRGVHLDVARHFFPVADVLRFIDLAAAHRLNRVHLHLNDDQGWRVEVPGWPRLTEVGAWRSSSPVGHEVDGVDDHVRHGGLYRAGDLVAIRDHATRRHVTIVPEIDLPGHAQAVVAAYPELGHGESVEVWTRWGISEHVLNVGDAALDFAEAVTTYVADIFANSPVHVGGDECPTTMWEASDLAHDVMARHGFTDPRELQGLFTTRVAAALTARGHTVLAWDEVLDATVPPGTVVTAWRSGAKGVEAARRGLDVVMASMQFLYFDWLNSVGPDEPVAQNAAPTATTWERVYGYRVVPDDLEPELVFHVRGAQAQLWTEYIATRDHLDYMTFPRLCALSEVLWGTATTAEDFRPRLERHLERLGERGVHFRPIDEPARS